MYQPRFIDLFDYLLFDMNGTLMTGGTRFDDVTSMVATFRNEGGRGGSDEEIGRLLADLIETLTELYDNPEHQENFPTVDRVAADHPIWNELSPDDRILVDRTLAKHEVGEMLPETRGLVARIGEVNRVGLLSNVWSSGEIVRELLQEQEILELFDVVVFSSDHGVLKPSSELFEHALEGFGNPPPNHVLFIGDDYRRDIVGAREMGFGTILVDPTRPKEPEFGDRVVGTIGELLTVR